MMTTLKARKNNSLASSILENMTMAMTLSDRLRQAGIRECEPGSETKAGNLNQKGKKSLGQKRNERNKMLQNLNNDFYSSYYKDYYQNKIPRGKNLPKIYTGFSKTLRRRIKGSAKKTIFTSLDFIKDCQKYKKKIRTPKKHTELKREQKNASVSSNHNRSLYVKEEPQMLKDAKTDSQVSYRQNIKKEALNLYVLEGGEGGNSFAREESSFRNQNSEKVIMKEASINDEGKNQSNKKVSETLPNVKPFFDEFPSGDVARIDKKYLQSLLSIANRTDKKDEDKSKKDDEKATEKHGEKKKKKSHKDSPESKIRIREPEESKYPAAETQNDSESVQISSHKDLVLARIVRDSTKSEAQILVQKENKFHNQRNSEMKSEKNVAHMKPDIKETRKKRKTRNKLIKNKSGEFPDSIFSNETPKAVDVKELWRRDAREKSENSLSSKSSTTVPKTDAGTEQENLGLESYKVLKKFVEEEVKKMSNESEKKNNLKEADVEVESNYKKDQLNSVNLKNSEKVENVREKLGISMLENPNDEICMKNTEMCDLKKKLMQAKPSQNYSTYEGEKVNAELLDVLTEDKLQDQRAKKKLITERGKNCEKTPSQIIQNWSILNRLEQAFVALGTPNFQSKSIKYLNTLKSENLVTNEKIRADDTKKGQERLEKINKKPQKKKKVANNKNSANAINFTSRNGTQRFQNKKSAHDEKRNLIKENRQTNNFKKESKDDSSQNNALVKTLGDKENNQSKKRKKISHQACETFPKKPTVRSFAKSKISDNELRYSKKEKEDVKLLSGDRSCVKMKKNESCRKKSLKRQNKNSEETLERKQTFDLIPKNNIYIMNPRKSKSCNKIDDNLESDSVRKRFLQMKNQESKSCDFFEKNSKHKPKSRGKSVENRMENKTKLQTPKKLVKTPIEDKSEIREKPNSSREKEYSKAFLENSVKTPKDKTDQEKQSENAEITGKFPKQIPARKESNKTNEKTVREHSVLSTNGNHNNTQATTKEFTQVEEVVTSNCYPAVKSNNENSEMEKAQMNLLENPARLVQSNRSTTSSTSASSYKLLKTDSTEKHSGFITTDSQHENPSEISKKLTPLFGSDNSAFHPEQQTPTVEKKESELKPSRCQPLWEQDIHHYHAIVKEIMSHYKRINGFLTQSDYSKCLPNDSSDLFPTKEGTNENSSNSFGNAQNIDLHEYRKKIMSEYQALPIFEYKRKLQQKEEDSQMSKEAKKRNLSVVKDVSTEMDLDVKDFHPKIQKVLNSQLYIDRENLVKRNQSNVKFKEKKSSLQEILLGKNEKMAKQECIRSSSTPKTFLLLPNSSVYFESTQTLKTIGSLQKYLTSTNTSLSYLEETESEIAGNKVGTAKYCSI